MDPQLLTETAALVPAYRAALAAELCETSVQVALADATPIFDLELSQFGAYRFDAENGRFAVLRDAAAPELARDAIEGPLLLHALAHRDVYVIHASGLLGSDGRAVLFCAQSGVGKSTLAHAAIGWQRLADDLLPVSWTSEDGVVVMPHLDQPKLAPEDQYPPEAPGRVPLAAFVELRCGPKAGIRALAGAEVLEKVLRHTVATRVYANASLTAHLKFCGHIADEVSAGRLLAAELTVADQADDIAGAVRTALELLQSTLR